MYLCSGDAGEERGGYVGLDGYLRSGTGGSADSETTVVMGWRMRGEEGGERGSEGGGRWARKRKFFVCFGDTGGSLSESHVLIHF